MDYELADGRERLMSSSSVARGAAEDAANGEQGQIAIMIPHVEIAVMIPCVVYRRLQEYLIAIQSSMKPEDLIANILEGYIRRLQM